MAGELATLIGANIRAARETKTWKQRNLANTIAELDPDTADPSEAIASLTQAVSDWEGGRRKPSDRYMPLIATALDQPVEWFYVDHRKSASTPNLFAVSDGEEESELGRIEAKIDDLDAKVEELMDALVAARIVQRVAQDERQEEVLAPTRRRRWPS